MSNTFKTKIVRPNGDEYPCTKNNRVTIPFYEEYKVFVKNAIGKRRMFELIIDGESVDEGSKFILGPYEEMSIERWMEGNLNSGSKFVFLPVDHPEAKHKAEETEAGIVRVKMWTEEPEKENVIIHRHEYYYSHPYYYRRYEPWTTWTNTCTSGDTFPTQASLTSSGSSMSYSCSPAGDESMLPVMDATDEPISFAPQGVTGKGAESGQRFVSVNGFDLGSEVEEAIFFLIAPANHVKAVEKGIKPKGHYCGHCKAKRQNPNHTFCPYCSRKY